MRKYIKSKSGNLVYTIERQSFTEKFRTPEDYFTHATRSVWYSTTGFNMFVQYKGAFYMIDRTDAHGYITSLEFSPVTAEEAAAAKMERAAQAMSEAKEHEAKTAAAALDYDTETAEAEAREARFSADYAEILAREAAELAAEAGTSNAASIAAAAAEYAERARRYADSATETAQQAAAEAESLAVVANDKTITAKAGAVSAMTRRVREEIAAAAPTYQRYELLAYLGEPDDYDVEAIEAEATRFTADGARVWSAFGDDLAAIAEQHELYSYAPAI